jgi:hypothetical protein
VELNKQKDAEAVAEKVSQVVNLVAPVMAAVASPTEQVSPSFEDVVAMVAEPEEIIAPLDEVVVEVESVIPTPEVLHIITEEGVASVRQDELPLSATVG